MGKKTTNFMQIIIAGFLSFLATLSTAQIILFVLWLIGDPEPQYQLITGIISGFIGLFVGGWITTRVMKSKDVWFSAFNGYLVGGVSAYYLLGLKPITPRCFSFILRICRPGGICGTEKGRTRRGRTRNI